MHFFCALPGTNILLGKRLFETQVKRGLVMPIFEFKCLACGHEFETLVMKSDEKVTCPKCQSDKVEKKLSSFATQGLGSLDSLPSGSSGCGSSGGFS